MTKNTRTASCLTVICGACTLLIAGCTSEEPAEVVQNAAENATEVAEDVSDEADEVADATSDSANEVADRVADKAGELAEKISEKAGEAAEKAGELAGRVSEKAQEYLTPLQDRFANLESLKDKPDELKEAVSGLITSIEEKAEDLALPQKISDALATAKQKLIELRDDLEGELEEAQIEERIQGIIESVREQLGMNE